MSCELAMFMNSWDVGRTLEKLVNHWPSGLCSPNILCDLLPQ